MDPGALNTYVPTLIRYGLVAVGVVVFMWIVYRIQIALGVKREAAAGRALVSPWVVFFLVFEVFPIGSSLYLSFTQYNLFKAPQWIGLDNYKSLFDLQIVSIPPAAQQTGGSLLPPGYEEVQRVPIGDGGFVLGAKQAPFWRSMRLTLLYAFLSVPIGLIGALVVALLLNQKVRGLSFWRVLYYMPAILPAVASALLWRWIFSSSGLLNGALMPVYNLLNMSPPRWFSDPNLALPALLIISLWGVFGANSVILLAGLKGIPQELYEAAAIDGAGNWGKFRNVTVPMLSPSLFYNLVISTIGAVQVFELAAFIPLPPSTGTFLNWLIYQQAFTFNKMGMASAMGWIMLVVTLALTLLIFRSSSAWVFYQGAREEKA
ncbi:MAG: carbohydrate ABC transporter permease [Aggregatilineales bacterium]